MGKDNSTGSDVVHIVNISGGSTEREGNLGAKERQEPGRQIQVCHATSASSTSKTTNMVLADDSISPIVGEIARSRDM